MMDRRPDRPGGAVDVLEGGRDPLEEGDGAIGRPGRVGAGDRLDLPDRLPHPLDRRLGAPAEGTLAEAGLELPDVASRGARRGGPGRATARASGSLHRRNATGAALPEGVYAACGITPFA